MKERKRAMFSGAVMAGVFLAAALPSAAHAGGFRPVLFGNPGPYCGPCEPAPLLTSGAPGSPVVALRYRWSAAAQGFELIAKQEVGVTDHQGDLRFGLKQGPGSVDKVVVWVGGALSDGFVFQTTDGCSGPRLCPLPRRFHVFANASAFLPGHLVVATVSGAEPGRVLDVAQEEYVEDGDAQRWIPAAKPASVEVDGHGHATVMLEAAGPGVYRVIGRDRETGEESAGSLFEVSEPRR